jgi:DNA-directed RNA polymerase specialized sigma24 family protein
MLAAALTNANVFHGDLDIEKVLEDFDGYVRSLAGRKFPRSVVRGEMLDMEVDEIVQNTRIKLWQALQRREIINIEAYVRCIVHTECVNMVRGRKPLFPLPINEEGELYQGKVLVEPGQGMQDPAYEFEYQEAFADWMMEVVDEVLALPQQQRHAMLSILIDWSSDVLPLAKVLIERGVDIEALYWPREKEELHKLKVSRSIARGKLRALREKKKGREMGWNILD